MEFERIPADLPVWRAREVEDSRLRMVDDAFVKAGVRYWKSNGAVIPPHVYRDAFVVCPPEQVAAYDKSMATFMADYRKKAARRPTAEERFEMRAAFGPGAKVVDIFTGRKIRV